MLRLEYVVKGIKRDGALSARKEHRPITPALLKKLFSVLERRQDLRMLWAAACVAFFAFLRVGEFTFPGTKRYDDDVHLMVRCIASMVFIRLKQSKTD